jgi:hypothetical protein
MSDENDPNSNIITLAPRDGGSPEIETNYTPEPTSYDQERMYQEYLRGITMTQISENWNVSYRTIQRYKEKLDWDGRKEKDIAQKAFLNESEVDTIARETYSKLLKICYRMVSDLERAVFEVDAEQQARTVPLKTVTDAVEKLTKLHYFAKAGGVEKKQIESKHTEHKIDYAKLARIHLDTKKQNPEYDEKRLLKDVVDAAYKKVEE